MGKAMWRLREEIWLAGQWERKAFSDLIHRVFKVGIDFTNRILFYTGFQRGTGAFIIQ
jgi:hypothetical protein